MLAQELKELLDNIIEQYGENIEVGLFDSNAKISMLDKSFIVIDTATSTPVLVLESF